jgi:hypothetical protein
MEHGQNPAPGTEGETCLSERNQSSRYSDIATRITEVAAEAIAALTETAAQTGAQAKQATVSLVGEANEKARDLMNQQVKSGADLVGHFGGSIKAAADHLEQQTPALAALVRSAAETVDDFSGTIREQTVERMFASVSDLARRRPVLVFGIGAALGFALFRLLKTDGTRQA